MGIKKQAINDAKALFEWNAAFWTDFDIAKAKGLENPKYDTAFNKTYNKLAQEFAAGREAKYLSKAAKASRRSRKPLGFAMIVVGSAMIIHSTGYDAVLLEKGKQRVRRAKL